MRLYDAHNHLHDERLRPWIDDIVETLPSLGVACAVVNGTSESDWEAVARLARRHSWIKPSFGLHPWYVHTRSPHWQDALRGYLAEFPNAAVGEIGLDRWIANPDLPAQEDAFRAQLDIASALGRPVTIHCLRAWGALEAVLSAAPLPPHGFLLHSYGEPVELVPKCQSVGACFSLSPCFTHERKSQQARVFAAVPLDRMLAETDAPDMWPPDSLNDHPLHDSQGNPLNHPANIELSYRKLAEIRSMALADLASQIEANFHRLFE